MNSRTFNPSSVRHFRLAPNVLHQWHEFPRMLHAFTRPIISSRRSRREFTLLVHTQRGHLATNLKYSVQCGERVNENSLCTILFVRNENLKGILRSICSLLSMFLSTLRKNGDESFIH